MTDRELFYAARDRRTVEFGVRDIFERTVSVFVGNQAAHCRRGQLAVLALVNMLARTHRSLFLSIPPTPLLFPAIVTAHRLDEAAHELARRVDPFIRLPVEGDGQCAIGLGADGPSGLPWYAGASGQIAIVDRHPVGFDAADSASLGACLTACLAAENLLQQTLGREARAHRISAWNLREGRDAEPGPARLGALDVGSVLTVGAGGVGSSFAYWLREFGVTGDWRVLDGDLAELHNTNRPLGIFPDQCGWLTGKPLNKAEIAAALIGARPESAWYDDFDHNSFKPDLILPLANERQVREKIAARGEPVLLHATTSQTWEAQLHRHVPDVDDCIVCRMPAREAQVALGCSTVKIQEAGESSDAALSFLSATAGLLLLNGLFRLSHGLLSDEPHNLWSIRFNDPRISVRRAKHRCSEGCASTLPARVRHRIHAGRRWSTVDRGPHFSISRSWDAAVSDDRAGA